MSSCDWLHNVAFGGCVAANLVFQVDTATESLAQANPSDVNNYSQRQDSSPSKNGGARQPEFILIAPVVVSPNKQPETGQYQPDCEQPKNAEDANFCQARRSAQAAEDAARAGEDSARANWKAADVARDQLNLAYAGFIGLLVTVGLTFWAAHAASRAAESSAASAVLADNTLTEFKRTSERELRAYIGFSIEGFEFLRGSNNAVQCEAAYSIKNHGQTPAYGIRVDSDFRIAPFPLKDDFSTPEKNAIELSAVANPGQQLHGAIVKGQSIEGRSKGDKLYLFGVVRYRDAFDQSRQTWFCGYIEDSDAIFAGSVGLVQQIVPVKFKWADRHNDAT
jgi:hypothetical protein